MTMKLSNPVTRSTLLLVTFVVILMHVFWSWVFARFVHAEAQYRTLMPRYYDVQVVSAEEYQRLADRSVPKVTLSDGTTMEKAPAWYDVVLPGYKPTPDKEHHVLVTTYGTGHVLSYLEPTLLLMGTLTCCGLGLSLWNLSLLKRESVPDGELSPASDQLD
jgi:hypothetical protein